MHVRAARSIEEDTKTPRTDTYSEDPEKSNIDHVPTVFQSILSSPLPPEEKRRDRMAQEGFIIIVAGSDTISRILTAATYHLLANEDAHFRLKGELEQAMPNPSMQIDVKSLEKLPWLVRFALGIQVALLQPKTNETLCSIDCLR